MSWPSINLISAALLPPLDLLLIGAFGLWLLRARPRLGRSLIALALAGLCLLSLPVVADRLLAWLEPYPALDASRLPHADAIVILGAGTYFDAPEYGGDTINGLALQRLRYGARLARQTGLPILVTGGSPAGGQPEGRLMQAALEQDFGVTVRWVETHSRTTWNNAHNSRRLLQPFGIRRIYLVTHAWHLPRAVYAFERAGFEVIPAGTIYSLARNTRPVDFIPHPRALQSSYFALHEGIGLIWYWLKG